MGFLKNLFYKVMSKALAKSETTNVVGFFNPNTWSIHLAISDLNIALQLKPKEYVLDRSGRKINDPLLQKYVGNKMLACETSADPVALVRIAYPRPVDNSHQASVQSGYRDSNGKWQPPLPPNPDSPISQAVAVHAVSSSHTPIRAMSIEEARKAGLVARTRNVPEDYGLTETTGLPSDGAKIPPIRLATDLVKRPVRPLPEELMQTNDPTKMALKQQLAQAQKFNPEKPPLLTGNVQEAAASVGLEEATNVIGGELPPPDLDDHPPAAKPAKPNNPSSEKNFVCQLDSKAFRYRSELKRHVLRKYPAQAEELMAQYPEE